MRAPAEGVRHLTRGDNLQWPTNGDSGGDDRLPEH